MPWNETCAMDERMRFAIAATAEGAVFARVCARFGISRKNGYKWLERFRREGVEGLRERSRAPHEHGRAYGDALLPDVLALRERYGWGARKLRCKLAELRPDEELPASSTIGDWLSKRGLTSRRHRRPRCPAYVQPFPAASAPNAVWTVDFKGWFRTGDGTRCDPLTLSDHWSRYLLRCQTVGRPDHDHVRAVFEEAFEEYGLPEAIRSDNGPPFATTAAGGLSPLSLWWLKLGIEPQRIEPAKPQQNGRHERMHRTLKHDTAKPPAPTLAEQQARFDTFRRIYNDERPHEALGQRYPAEHYEPSRRRYTRELREPVYDGSCELRRVRSNGEIKWKGERVFVSQVLTGEPVGVDLTADGEWRVRYAHVELGYIDLDRRRLNHHPKPSVRPK